MITVIRCADVGLKAYMLYEDFNNNQEANALSTTSKILSAAGLILQSFGYVGGSAGISNATLKNIKVVEACVRFVDMPVKCVEAADGQIDMEDPDMKALINRGVVVPFFTFVRTMAEWDVLEHKAYFDLPPDERAKQTRSKYVLSPGTSYATSYSGHAGAGLSFVYAGEEIKDPEKELKDLENGERALPLMQFFEVAASYKDMKDRERFAFAKALIQQQGQLVLNHAQLIAAALQQHLAANQNQNNQNQNNDPFDLVHREDIPDFLEDDEIFDKYKCPITARPIRDPVGDPTTRNARGMTLYERSAIVEALETNEVSPTTKAGLTEDELVEQPFIRALIDDRLRFYSTELRNHAQNHFNTPANPAALQAARHENPRY